MTDLLLSGGGSAGECVVIVWDSANRGGGVTTKICPDCLFVFHLWFLSSVLAIVVIFCFLKS